MSHHSNSLPITESSNPLTEKIDTGSPAEIVRILRQVDGQVFGGWLGFPGLLDEEILSTMGRVAWRMSRVLAAGEAGGIVLAGAGTSGRLSVFLAREFNRQLRQLRAPEAFRACIAGGSRALVTPVEAAEDRAASGIEDLRAAMATQTEEGLYIGITAGLSAPYVAAQMHHLRQYPEWAVALVGFNTLDMARTTKAEPNQPSMAEAIAEWATEERFYPLVPAVGPEAVRGSTRMKGGTATKLLLETIFQVAVEAAGLDGDREKLEIGADGSLLPLRRRLIDCLLRYRSVFDSVYLDPHHLGDLVKLAANAIKSMGKIYYLGRSTAGMIGMMDAAECPPTFGSDPNDVRAYTGEGWAAWFGEDDIPAEVRDYKLGFEDFEEDVLPELGRGDLVIGLGIKAVSETVSDLLEKADARKSKTALVLIGTQDTYADDLPRGLDHFCYINVAALGFRAGYLNEAEMALKLALNNITTGGHILSGRVFGNTMIELRLLNTKLYARSLRIIQQLIGVGEEAAIEALHCAVFKTDALTPEQRSAQPMAVVRQAGDRRGIVSAALLKATGLFTVAAAQRALMEDPSVRRVIEAAVNQRAGA